MGFGWKDIVPGDPYIVYMGKPISPSDLNYVTQLYQPLIGPLSVSLYITLYHEHMIDEKACINHRSLMSVMGTPLNQLVKARETLEAVGLMQTVRIFSEQGNQLFEYKLLPPMLPTAFFGDDMMSMILLNRVGKSRYHYLREKFLVRKNELEVKGDREEITKGFDEVFSSIMPTELTIASGSETEYFLSQMESMYPAKESYQDMGKDGSSGIYFRQIDPDFVFLEASLPKTLGKSRTLGPEICELLKELSFFYQIDDMQLSYFLQEPYVYNDHNELDAARLRWFIKDWYLRSHQGQQPVVGQKAVLQPSTESEPIGGGQSREQEHKQALSKLSPIALLELYQDGGKASPADIKLVEELTEHYKLVPGVINVLLEYVMITNNKQLPKALIQKIASHWKRLAIQTVDQALEQAKQLYHDTKQKGKTRKETTPKSPSSRNVLKKDELPEWVVRQMEHKQIPSNEQQEEVDEHKKKEALELLRALGEID
ncbi:MAG TPA: DnaD domain protein [Bacillota bacterium]|nr:DnaD domain protein [Bacillota bacterium]